MADKFAQQFVLNGGQFQGLLAHSYLVARIIDGDVGRVVNFVAFGVVVGSRWGRSHGRLPPTAVQKRHRLLQQTHSILLPLPLLLLKQRLAHRGKNHLQRGRLAQIIIDPRTQSRNGRIGTGIGGEDDKSCAGGYRFGLFQHIYSRIAPRQVKVENHAIVMFVGKVAQRFFACANRGGGVAHQPQCFTNRHAGGAFVIHDEDFGWVWVGGVIGHWSLKYKIRITNYEV